MGLYTAYTETPYVVLTADTSSCMEVLGDADVKASLRRMSISFNGTSSSQAPILVKIRQITATGTGTACTELSADRSAKSTSQCQAKFTLTVEPTMVATVALDGNYVHPQGGLWTPVYERDEIVICDGSASQGIAIELTSASGVTPTCFCLLQWYE